MRKSFSCNLITGKVDVRWSGGGGERAGTCSGGGDGDHDCPRKQQNSKGIGFTMVPMEAGVSSDCSSNNDNSSEMLNDPVLEETTMLGHVETL